MGVSKNYRFDHFTLCKMEPETLRKKARFASGVFFCHEAIEITCSWSSVFDDPNVRCYSWQNHKNMASSILVGGFKHFLFSVIYGIILPID
jgi:hypothetical protein